ncbi:MAG: hypothetical protein ACRERV_07760 [Methylococcales bacterium]
MSMPSNSILGRLCVQAYLPDWAETDVRQSSLRLIADVSSGPDRKFRFYNVRGLFLAIGVPGSAFGSTAALAEFVFTSGFGVNTDSS